jgi:raffinose/stachyose/melibiose transport system substrate-binding protein
MCKQIRAAGKIPFALALGAGTSAVQNTFWGLALVNPYRQDPNWTQERTNNQVTFATSPMWRGAIQGMVDMKDAGCFPPHPEGLGIAAAVGLVASGQAVMMMSNSALNSGLQAANPSFNLDSTFAMPAETAAQTRVLVYVSPVVGVNRATSHPDESLKVVEFLARADQNAAFNTAAQQVSPIAASKGELPAWGNGIAQYFKAKRTINNPSAAWPNPNLIVILGSDVIGLFTGQKSVDDVLRDLDANWNP